jgi:class 3 adenylate cyclase
MHSGWPVVSRFVDPLHRSIHFTTTEDGVDIAFWEIGEGKPVVILNNFGLSHAELEWGVPSISSFYVDMAQRYRVIRFDPRGTGLSGEPPGGWDSLTESGAHPGMTTHAMGLDIEAVAAALELERFALLALSVQGPVAIAYTATHPQVGELILCDSMSSIATSWLGPVLRTQMGVEIIELEHGGAVFNWWERIGPYDEVADLMRLARASDKRGSPGVVVRTQLEWDEDSLLTDISIPTAVLVTRDRSEVDSGPDARHLAAGIKGSELCGLGSDEGSTDRGISPYWTDRAATLEAIDSLLKPESPAGESLPSDFRTVVFTDIVGSTEYIRSVGDEAGRAAVRELELRVASFAADHGGRVVKNLGDGSLVSFGSNSSAITFGLELQEACRDGPLYLRVGMSAGEPIQEEGDIHGTVVAHASRIGDLGDAGEVIVSDSVRQLASGKGFSFEERGEVSLKGFDEPERVWKVTRP